MDCGAICNNSSTNQNRGGWRLSRRHVVLTLQSIEATPNKLSFPGERWTNPVRDQNAKRETMSQAPLAGKHFALARNYNHRIPKRAAEASHHLLCITHQLDLIFADLGLPL